MADNVNHPKHYETGPFECIELSSRYSFALGGAIKYVWRYPMKNGMEDLEKARWYLRYAKKHGEEVAPVVRRLPGDPRRPAPQLIDMCIGYDGFAPARGFWTALRDQDIDGMLTAVETLIAPRDGTEG